MNGLPEAFRARGPLAGTCAYIGQSRDPAFAAAKVDPRHRHHVGANCAHGVSGVSLRTGAENFVSLRCSSFQNRTRYAGLRFCFGPRGPRPVPKARIISCLLQKGLAGWMTNRLCMIRCMRALPRQIEIFRSALRFQTSVQPLFSLRFL